MMMMIPTALTPHLHWPTVWQSHAHATAIKTDPSYPTFFQDREALATAPVFEVHVPFSGDPLRMVEAPVTEVDFYKTDDREVNPDAKPVAEIHDMVRRVNRRIELLQLPGFIALNWGIAIEDGTRAVSLGAWKSIEVGLTVHPLILFIPVRPKG
jgi:hypothetical protein